MIAWIESDGINSFCHMINHEKQPSKRSLCQWQQSASGFCRIHTNYLVNIGCISSLDFGETPQVKLTNGDILPVNKIKLQSIANDLLNFFGNEIGTY